MMDPMDGSTEDGQRRAAAKDEMSLTMDLMNDSAEDEQREPAAIEDEVSLMMDPVDSSTEDERGPEDGVSLAQHLIDGSTDNEQRQPVSEEPAHRPELQDSTDILDESAARLDA